MKQEPIKAWQPLTFGGVARYGFDWVGKLLFACFIVSLLTASVVFWAVNRAWFPVIEEAIAHLPAGAEIRGGRLTAPGPVRLAENLFLSISLDPVDEAAAPSLADIQVTLKPGHVRFRSLFGVELLPYRPEWTVPLGRSDWEARWPAWKPAFIGYLFLGTIVALFASWISLGILYALPARLMAFILKRSLSLWGAWKLSVAAMIPAAILMSVVLGVYGLGQIRVAELLLAWALHFLVGWIFIVGAVVRLPRFQKAVKNPFINRPSEDSESEEQKKLVEKNPFKRATRKKQRSGPPSS